MDENEIIQQEENTGAEDSLTGEPAEESQDDSLDLTELNEEGQETQGEEPQSAGGLKEPGYVQKRISKAVEQAVAQVRAEYDAKLAPLMERMLEEDARALVQSGQVKDLETAKELVRYRQGRPQPVETEQPRNEKGQFAPKQDNAADIRADMLARQAQKVKASRGIDVMAEFNRNEETRNKVLSGEWDFYDVADAVKEQKARRKAPAPMRSSNGASGAEKSTIASMSDEQFDRLNKRLEEGARFKV